MKTRSRLCLKPRYYEHDTLRIFPRVICNIIRILSEVLSVRPISEKVITMYRFCIFFIGASVRQSVAFPPVIVTVNDTRTSVRHCPNVWQWQAIRYRYQTSDILHCRTTVSDSGWGPSVIASPTFPSFSAPMAKGLLLFYQLPRLWHGHPFAGTGRRVDR